MTIADYKNLLEAKLPPESDVINRNKSISRIYAELYLQHPHIFKWAGMAAFASNHIGIGLIPYHLKGFELLDLSNSCHKKGLRYDFNLLRHINNRIYDDIAWTHQAYLDGGIALLQQLMKDDEHYKTMLDAWIALDMAANNEVDLANQNHQIWLANAQLLRHEQEVIVQPMFDKFGALFKKLLTLCASLDFSPNHFKTDIKYHSSFLWYTYSKQFGLLRRSYFIPDLTLFDQRWTWLENRVVGNWIAREQKKTTPISSKLEVIYQLKGCDLVHKPK